MRKLIILAILAILVLGVVISLVFFEEIFGVSIDNTFIIWNFAIAIVIGIVVITILWYRKKRKEKGKKKERKIIYYQTEGEDKYRTEYY